MLQEELDTAEKSQSEQEHIKIEHKDVVECLQQVVSAAPGSKII